MLDWSLRGNFRPDDHAKKAIKDTTGRQRQLVAGSFPIVDFQLSPLSFLFALGEWLSVERGRLKLVLTRIPTYRILPIDNFRGIPDVRSRPASG
jgi:hypothetical protein